ncbi:DUF2138 domain-containing protein [Pectobacterium wasabiae]|uniref:DUF2138 domain-containing protein n=1 Tax=Pectobacterium wasabiae TaxID=55208 RepID=A0AAW3EGJ2_9GAMM|nr:DUF2138 domain-containing protein [Pectobacterium wasabiae]AOR65405.1 hypothetical protein A7983_19490 [Pectobacterium wasabiae CFBP 3304]KFX01451.1 hypothetical protein JV38_22280 [Pectobacterium wasabiae]KGA26336.1 hypothetical protein KU73_21940 [Pectobacterium wasabiae]
MTAENKNVAPVAKKSFIKYGLWAATAILAVSAVAWGIQRVWFADHHNVQPPNELVWKNNLQVDLHHPDVLIESASLSKLPNDLLSIPFLRDTLTEDFVFYYENNADRLGLIGSLRRITFEHDLTLRDNLLETLLDQPVNIALWHDDLGKLNHFMAVIKRGGLARLLEPLAKAAAEDTQLGITDFSQLKVGSDAIPVYQWRYGANKQLFFASHGDNLLLFSDLAMLYDQQAPSQDSTQITSTLLSGANPWPESFGLKPRDGGGDKGTDNDKNTPPLAHRISVSANYLGFGYQRFVPAFAGVRVEMGQQGWQSYLALNDQQQGENARFDLNPVWKSMPIGASFCVALPVSQSVPEYLFQRIDAIDAIDGNKAAAFPLALNGVSGLCWYPDSHLYSPLFVSQLAQTADAQTDETLTGMFTKVIGAREKQPIPVESTSKGQGHLWQREASSRYGQYPQSEAKDPESLLGNQFFRVSLARHGQMLMFSLDDKLVNKALQTLDKNFPPLADVLPQQAVVPVYMAPEALSGLFKQEVFASLPKSVEPVFYNAAQTLLLPKLSALAGQQRYALTLPADTKIHEHWQWLPLKWQEL